MPTMPPANGLMVSVISNPPLAGCQDGPDDVLITGAAAEVALQANPDTGRIQVVVLVDQRHGSHDHSRSAVAALQGMALVEGLLHGMQAIGGGQPLDRRHLAPVRLHGQHQARLDEGSINQHRAGPALADDAADVRARQPKLFAQEAGSYTPLTLPTIRRV